MMSSKSQRWIEAGKILAENPKGKVLCPECERDKKFGDISQQTNR